MFFFMFLMYTGPSGRDYIITSVICTRREMPTASTATLHGLSPGMRPADIYKDCFHSNDRANDGVVLMCKYELEHPT
jgi:hypothetical protein